MLKGRIGLQNIMEIARLLYSLNIRYLLCVMRLECGNKYGTYLIVAFLLSLDTVCPVTVDVCNGYEFIANCGAGELIVMDEANLGRMEPGQCLPDEMGNFGCKNDILFLTDRWCSGRKQCEFTSPNKDIMQANTECRQGLAVYLRATYSCISVNGYQCSTTSPNLLEMSSGILSSHITDEIGCGSTRSPWIIKAKHGQTVELSLLDFKALDRARTNGCSDPKPPPRAWYKRNGNEAVIGCEASDKEWRLTCSGNRWHGKMGNCTTSVIGFRDDPPKKPTEFQLSTIVIVAGIIGGTIVLAVAVIVCGVVYIQKYKDRKEKKYNESTNQEKLLTTHPMSDHNQCSNDPPKSLEGQDDYLEPNTTQRAKKLQQNVDEPLIHIWETPLPDPSNPNRMTTLRECTVHRKPKEGQTLPGSNPTALRKDHIRTGTSYYSPNTGHKYYVVDREN
ncbi:hypothetical protein LSH36_200g02277 [Paralvinella palmiformis]|uniref:Uncharacterized protein n=1 Tax=Paralvinella palmiformis TaxID=53620 RepID=A0AAD9N694_9ANNE|nr:hypothetical protein LSH36_200g02277 [Paralvinella palmiformis]